MLRPKCTVSPKNTSEECTCSPSSPKRRAPSPLPVSSICHVTVKQIVCCPAGPGSLHTHALTQPTTPRLRVHGPRQQNTRDSKIPSSFTGETQPTTLVHKSHLFLLAPIAVIGQNQAGMGWGVKVQEWRPKPNLDRVKGPPLLEVLLPPVS